MISSAQRIAPTTAHIVAETCSPCSYCASFRDTRIEAAISRTHLRPSSTLAFSPWWYSEPSYSLTPSTGHGLKFERCCLEKWKRVKLHPQKSSKKRGVSCNKRWKQIAGGSSATGTYLSRSQPRTSESA